MYIYIVYFQSKYSTTYTANSVGLILSENSSTLYRYGFQGQETDDEIKGEGNSVNYKYRMHDPRIGRFFAVDPLAPKYPYYTPYSFSGNRVIDAVELEGLEPALYNIYDNGNIVGTAILNYGTECYTGCVINYQTTNNQCEVVSSYDIMYQFVKFVETTTGPVPMPLSYESTAPNVGIDIGGQTFSQGSSLVEYDKSEEVDVDWITDWTAPIIDGSKDALERVDNLWVKKKNGKFFKGPQVSSTKYCARSI
jgi:RHS repeat-associated protein